MTIIYFRLQNHSAMICYYLIEKSVFHQAWIKYDGKSLNWVNKISSQRLDLFQNPVHKFYGKLKLNSHKTICSWSHRIKFSQYSMQGYHIIFCVFLTKLLTWFIKNPGQVSHRFHKRILEWRFWGYPTNSPYRNLRWIFAKCYAGFSNRPKQVFQIMMSGFVTKF